MPDLVLGAILGSLNLAVGALTLLGPLVVQRIGRGGAVVLGTLSSAVAMAVIGFAPAFGVVAGTVILRAGIFYMTLPLYRALVIDGTPASQHMVVSVILTTAANVGPTVGPPISGYVQRESGFAPLFGATIALYALAAGVFAVAARAFGHKRHLAPVKPVIFFLQSN